MLVRMLKYVVISVILVELNRLMPVYGIGLSLNKIVKVKILVHAFILIYLSTVTNSHRLEHYGLKEEKID